MTRKEYNGWTNYETWLVKLWIDNDEGSSVYWADRAGEIATSDRSGDAIRTLASEIEESHRESLPELSGFAADLMNAALSEVNWEEIASHMLDDVKEVAS